MSSKKFVYLLIAALVCGLIAGGTAYGQSTLVATFKGTVMNDDGTPAPGYAISGETVPANAAFRILVAVRRVPMAATTVAISFGGPKVECRRYDKNHCDQCPRHTMEVLHIR